MGARRPIVAEPPLAAGRVLLFRGHDEDMRADVLAAVETAVSERRVVVIEYEDSAGAVSTRAVEPAGLVRGIDGWYLVGWCRLRGAGRSFRLDRVRTAVVRAEQVHAHEVRGMRADVPAGWAVVAGAEVEPLES